MNKEESFLSNFYDIYISLQILIAFHHLKEVQMKHNWWRLHFHLIDFFFFTWHILFWTLPDFYFCIFPVLSQTLKSGSTSNRFIMLQHHLKKTCLLLPLPIANSQKSSWGQKKWSMSHLSFSASLPTILSNLRSVPFLY